jgi:cystathionine beta-lyase
MEKDKINYLDSETQVVYSGRHPQRQCGAVNPPVYHVSTILSPTLSVWKERAQARLSREPGMYYGRFGTPTVDCLTEAMAQLEGAKGSFVYPSGVAAISSALLSVLSAGDHVLMVDCVYSPTRQTIHRLLKRYGVSISTIASNADGSIDSAFCENTKVVFIETPGSLTFEMQDIAAICEIAHQREAVVLADTTWSTPLCCKMLDLGVDIAINAATKYIVGHSDAMLGVASANERCYEQLRQTTYDLGQTAGPDDCYLAQRGLRTMAIRLKTHYQNALKLIQWLSEQPEVQTIRYPAWNQDPGYPLWKRDFTGASGLFSIWLEPINDTVLSVLIDHLQLFGIGASWGGYESLVMPFDLSHVREHQNPAYSGTGLRFHAGLENADDLIEDLQQGFDRMRKAKHAQ